MEEILNTGNAPLGQKEFTFPANVKQMGNIDRKFKIYIEDYVYTYIYQYAKTGGSREKLMVLVGKHTYVNDCDILIISGALQGKYASAENGIQTFTDESWLYINEQMRKFFDGESILGWCHIQPEFGIFMMARDENFHKRCFKNSYQVFCTIDPIERQECFYTYNEDRSALRPVKGYFIYYVKNESMQEYMLERRERSSSEEGPDKVMKSIRNIIKEKEELREQKKSARFMYGVSAFMVVVILVIGINLMNNYQKMKKFDKSISSLMVQMSGNDATKEDDVVPVNKLEGGVYPTEAETPAEETSVSATATESVIVTTVAPEEEQTVAATVKEPVIYTVKSGDTIMGICKRYYGDTSKCKEVIAYNDIKDENVLYIGQQIKLP